MSAKTPRSKRKKGKQLEELVSQVIHNYALKHIPKYKQEFELNNKIRPHRDYSSGNYKSNPCDVELNYLQVYYPFCIECKNWSEFKNYSIFDLFKKKSKLLTLLSRAYNQNEPPDNLIRLVVFKSNYTDVLCYIKITDISEYLIDNFRTFVLLDNNFLITKFEEFIESWTKEEVPKILKSLSMNR